MKHILCLILLSGSMRYTFAQQPTTQPSSLAKETKDALIQPGKKLFDSLLQSGKNVTQSITSKLNLFKPQAFKINNINVDIDYNYLKDTSGLSTGLLYDMR